MSPTYLLGTMSSTYLLGMSSTYLPGTMSSTYLLDTMSSTYLLSTMSSTYLLDSMSFTYQLLCMSPTYYSMSSTYLLGVSLTNRLGIKPGFASACGPKHWQMWLNLGMPKEWLPKGKMSNQLLTLTHWADSESRRHLQKQQNMPKQLKQLSYRLLFSILIFL